MRVMAIAAQKGGSGKTTLAANVAVQAERSGDVGSGWFMKGPWKRLIMDGLKLGEQGR